ncbi:MAG: DUF2961 domain-containing protein [Phycisphaeraceae bacterium]|nr:DUF2961 domain-containing protein [Phycisphaeraceae bacterium]
MPNFNGLCVNLSNLSLLSNAQTRSISPENPDGAKGGGGRAVDENHQPSKGLGRGWKVRPCVTIEGGQTFEVANIEGPGAIQQIWMTPTGVWRFNILRFYWDDQEQPSVECPVGDFFASGFGHRDDFRQINSLAVCVNPGSAFNCYWPMPFRGRCRITLENLDTRPMVLYYQVNYALNDVPVDAAYFHAQFRRVNPLLFKRVYTILDGVRGSGHYVGTAMSWGVNNNGWWGEGEIKFYLDGDIPKGNDVAEHGGDAFPTICGTGTEDYFCGSYNFEDRAIRKYCQFTTAYCGLPRVSQPDGTYHSQQRFDMYRWHITDPVRFQRDITVTMQALGWRQDKRYLPLQDDIASVAYWYQQLPTGKFPALPSRDALEIV